MSLIKIEPALRDMIHGLGSDPEMEAVKIFNMGLKELLRECEEEIIKLEIKLRFESKIKRINQEFCSNLPAKYLGRVAFIPRAVWDMTKICKYVQNLHISQQIPVL